MHYQPFYCEENVWHLAQDPVLAGRASDVVVISNERRSCAVWHQRAARKQGAPILWDYHVVLLAHDQWEIWDLDTTLGLPRPAEAYLRETFRGGVAQELEPLFRVVPAPLFVSSLASDRAHMRGLGGRFLREPPPWPPIGAEGATPNLDRFIDVREPFLGEVLDKPHLLARVAAA